MESEPALPLLEDFEPAAAILADETAVADIGGKSQIAMATTAATSGVPLSKPSTITASVAIESILPNSRLATGGSLTV